MTTLKQYKEEVEKKLEENTLKLEEDIRTGNVFRVDSKDVDAYYHVVASLELNAIEEAIETCEKIMNEKVEMLKKEIKATCYGRDYDEDAIINTIKEYIGDENGK